MTTNPYPKAPSGSYKGVLVSALEHARHEVESKEFAKGEMKLAIVGSITGNVRTFPELSKICADALKQFPQTDLVKYYVWGLENNQFVVASSNGAYVYDPDNKSQVAHVQAALKKEGDEVIYPYFS